jgi:hypothetical protein
MARQRVVLLGASNMTRGFAVLSELCRRAWGDVEILAAVGHGRSYGLAASVLGRRLPGILSSGLWRALAERPSLPTFALVGDVGNDVLYGSSVETILGWVKESVQRLREHGAHVCVTSLPAPVRTLSRARFTAFRTVFFPARHLTFETMQPAVAALDDGLRQLAKDESVDFVPLQPEWYGFDPIHIRPLACRRAWSAVLSAAGTPVECPRVGLLRSMKTYLLFPEQQWLFGREMRRAQPCRTWPSGASVSMY